MTTGSASMVPRLRLDTDAGSSYIDDLFDDAYFDDRLKERIETLAMDLLVRQFLQVADGGIDDPFDAIYLSDLRPEAVVPSTKMRLYRFRNIRDLSDEIDFDDDLDHE